jgi:anti-sigma B factor antagonist
MPDAIPATEQTGPSGELNHGLLQVGRPEVSHVTIDTDVAAVRVSGELDLATVGELEATVEQALTHRSVRLLIDLTGCGFIDSSVVSLLFDLRARFGNSGRPRLAVVAKDQPLRVLQLTELDRETPVFSSLPEALKAIEVTASSNSDAEV